MLKGLESIAVAARVADLALLKLAQEASIVVGVAEDGDPLVVLGSSADERHAANINLLDGLGDADVDLGNSILEGVQVADDVVNLIDVLVCKVLLVGFEVASENTSVDSRVQSLDTASKHLWRLGDGADVPTRRGALVFLSLVWPSTASSRSRVHVLNHN